MPNNSNTLTKPEVMNIAPRSTGDGRVKGVGNSQELMFRLAELLGGKENAQIWLDNPHPVLGGRTPQSYDAEGKLTQVLSYFITAIETGQPS
jgi:hypothetical protein